MPIRPENRHRYPQDWKLRSKFVRFYRAKGRCDRDACLQGRARDRFVAEQQQLEGAAIHGHHEQRPDCQGSRQSG